MKINGRFTVLFRMKLNSQSHECTNAVFIGVMEVSVIVETFYGIDP